MDYIWSPWRMDYIKNYKKQPVCIFCEVQDQADSADNLIVYRGKRAYVILNRFPYTSGHLMIVPYAHTDSLEALDNEARAEIMELISKSILVVGEVYRPEGYNAGINLGEAAGAGIKEHLHFHVVPRWLGDTNFMSSLGNTRVLPESLEVTYNRVREAFEKHA